MNPSHKARFLPLWVVFVLFAIAAVSVAIFHGPIRPTREPTRDWTIPDLYAHLQETLPKLHVLPSNPNSGDPSFGFYLTAAPMTYESLGELFNDPEHKEKWRGIVLCQSLQSDLAKENEILRWGDGGLLLPSGIAFVGDPALIEEVKKGISPR
jgi:hypothetical protein